jgi:hypothetical protein
VPSLSRLPLFDRLRDARSVLVAGAGGGFDIYAGLSLAFALEAEGKDVHLANLSFSSLADPDFWIAPGLASVGPDSLGDDDYFPERTLARWLTAHNRPQPIYAFAATGVKPLRSIYTTLADKLGLDAVILVDGGTDILMRGDEARIGTPEEDMASLAALHGLEDIPIRILASVGFGIEAHHGVNHVQVLENIAGLIRAGSYLGAFSIPPDSPEGRSYVDAVADAAAATPAGPSIVNGQIAAALTGGIGNQQFTRRTASGELFSNPLMSIYFTFDLDGVGNQVNYLASLADTKTRAEVALAIETYRYDTQTRPGRTFPH